MVLLLVLATLALLGLASVMAVVAWKLLREGRERSAARVAALEQRSSLDEDEPAREELVEVRHRPQPRFDRDHDDELDDDWDLAIRPSPKRPAAIHDDMFGASAAGPIRPRGHGWAAAIAAIVVLAAGTGVVYAVRHADSSAGIARRITGSNPAAAEPLELLSLRHVSDPGGAFIVTGLVQNPVDGVPRSGVVAVVYLFDEQGHYFASGRANLDVGTIGPGDESPFVVSIPHAASVSRYRVGFRLDDGGVVTHVDRRGNPPHGTTGDGVSGAEREIDRELPAPRRVEG